jgi:hypothetical protein
MENKIHNNKKRNDEEDMRRVVYIDGESLG